MEEDLERRILYLLSTISKYEETIENLTAQVDFYCAEQEKLQANTTVLLRENKGLAETVSDLLQIQSKCNNEFSSTHEDDLMRNLKSQLSSVIKEKDYAVELWQNALKTVDNLEETLKFYQNFNNEYIPKETAQKLQEEHENEIKKLSGEIEKYKIAQVQQASHKIFADDSKGTQLTNSKEIENLKERIMKLSIEKKELKKQIELNAKTIKRLKTEDQKSKSKVTEALQLIEIALMEKENALQREKDTKEQIETLSNMLSTINEEIPEKFKNEIETTRRVYNEKLKLMNDQTHKLNEEIHLKTLQLENLAKDHQSLQQELCNLRKDNGDGNRISKLLSLEKNLESTFQQLLLCERKNFQLSAERDSTKADMEEMRENFKNDIKSREAEKQVLKQKIELLQRQNNTFKAEIINLNRRLETVITDAKNVQEINIKKLSKKIKLLQNSLNESLKQLELQVKLNAQWKEEITVITGMFQKKIEDLKTHKKLLKTKLMELHEENLNCKHNLKEMCSVVCAEII